MVDKLVNTDANARRIEHVENCFGSAGKSLNVNGRVLVGEGVLTKICRKRPKARQFFLFNDILVYGNIVISKRKYNKQHIIPLDEIQLQGIIDNEIHKNGWLIKTKTKSFAVYATTKVEKEEWMMHIEKCIEDLLKKTGKKQSESLAPVWVPDNETTVCMNCNQTQFSMLVRRHHCRKCGLVVCNPCSSRKCVLKDQSSKPVRVCKKCYEVTMQSENDDTKGINELSNPGAESSDDTDDEDDGHKADPTDESKFYADNN